MSTIYDLKHNQQALLDSLYWLEDGEEADIIRKQLEQIEGSVERKLSYLSDVLAEAIGLAQIATERKRIALDRLTRKEDQAKRAEEKLRQFILSVMVDFNLKSVKGDLVSLSHYLSAGSVKFSDNFDVNRIDLELCEQIPASLKPITSEIAKRLKAGEEIEGAWLEKKEVLKIS